MPDVVTHVGESSICIAITMISSLSEGLINFSTWMSKWIISRAQPIVLGSFLDRFCVEPLVMTYRFVICVVGMVKVRFF